MEKVFGDGLAMDMINCAYYGLIPYLDKILCSALERSWWYRVR